MGDLPRGSKRGENEFSGKKRKRHVLTFPKAKLHAKNQKILSRGFPGKGGGERQTARQTETDPNSRVLRTLSLSRRTKKTIIPYTNFLSHKQHIKYILDCLRKS